MEFPRDITIHQERSEQPHVEKILRLNSFLGKGGQGSVYSASLFKGMDVAGQSSKVGVKSVNGGPDHNLVKNVEKNINELKKASKLFRCNGLMKMYFIVIPRAAYMNEHLSAERNTGYTFYHTMQSNTIYLGISLAPGQSLLSAINASRNPSGYTYDAKAVFVNLLTSVLCMHNVNIVHRDLKPENIMVEGNNTTIIDFGSMCHIDKCTMPPDAFTFEYSPVEVVNAASARENGMHKHYVGHNEFYKRFDVFSIGCILYEMLTLRKIFDNPMSAITWNSKTNTITASLNIEADNPQFAWKRLIMDCINPDPRERPDLNQAFLDRVAALPNPDFTLFTGIAPAAAAAASAEGGRRAKTRRRVAKARRRALATRRR